MKYKVFFDDWPTYEGDTLFPDIHAPAIGVQVIVMPNEDGGIMTVSKSDYYVLDKRKGDPERRWYGCDIFGLFDYLMSSGVVLFGRTINSKEFRKILNEATKTEF